MTSAQEKKFRLAESTLSAASLATGSGRDFPQNALSAEQSTSLISRAHAGGEE